MLKNLKYGKIPICGDKMYKDIIKEIDEVPFVYRDKLNINSKDKFGIEIEFEKALYYDVKKNLNKIKGLKKWCLHYESTVQESFGVGGEVVSPILHNTKKNWLNIKKVCAFLKEKGAIAGEHTGGHIHFDQKILSDNPKYILNLLKIWTCYEHIIYPFSHGKEII